MVPNIKIPRIFTSDDITVIICIRAHDKNPWVIDRLKDLHGYYLPKPIFIIVDFGSSKEFSDQIAKICEDTDLEYIHVPDYDTFSLSLARNIGFSHAQTELIYFTDIDFISSSDMFGKLASSATIARMDRFFDLILNIPAYHLTSRPTKEITESQSRNARDFSINAAGFDAFFEPLKATTEFIAPYSNNFLITSKFFSLLGGYHSSFRGHGSEDFEFFIRAAHIGRYFPLPESLLSDLGGSNKPQFFEIKPFSGFRSLNQMFAARAERLGLKTYHLWHPTPNSDSWRSSNDWKRDKLNSIVKPYFESSDQLLAVDSLERNQKIVCICTSKEQWGYFLPLRALNNELIPFFDKNPETIKEIDSLISERKVDGICIFNPYMKSHSSFLSLFMKARSLNLKTIVIERGALPGTIYYSDDVCYSSGEYKADTILSVEPTEAELLAANEYMLSLRKGQHLLEGADSRKKTDAKYSPLRGLKKRKIFIPLQLDDDMAVTKFVRDSQTYHQMIECLSSTLRKFSDVLFIVKPHPLSKFSLDSLPENAIIADRSDNVHSLLDSCDSVICYNSGVGLLAACHGRRLVTIGNAFYNISGIGHFADDLEQAIEMCLEKVAAPDIGKVEKLLATYLYHRYSWFSAQDDIREFDYRKSHAYKNIFVSRIVLDGKAVDLEWEAVGRPFHEKSYGFAIANFSRGLSDIKATNDSENNLENGQVELVVLPNDINNDNNKEILKNEIIRNTRRFKIYSRMYSPFLNVEQKRRLNSEPLNFFKSAKRPFSVFGRSLMKKYINT